MISNTKIPAWLAEFGPQKPLADLVTELNSIFHAYHAAEYTREHPEIYDFLPSLWREMISLLPQRNCWRVLDFGCGAGFEARQVLDHLGNRVQTLFCYDPSKEMLAQCKFHLRDARVATLSCVLDEANNSGPFNLLVTNSVLHHLADIRETISTLIPHLTSDAWWISGHEPSCRFYRNDICVELLSKYKAFRRWRRFVDPVPYLSRLRVLCSRLLSKDPLRLTAETARARGLFKKVPSSFAVDRLVDFHVPHSAEEVAAGRGLDFETMHREMAAHWELRFVKTYFFLGQYHSSVLPKQWDRRCEELAERFPNDGANFFAVWSRT